MTVDCIASTVFDQFGLGMETARRAGGWTNAVWFNEGFALRLSMIEDSDRIRREVRLSKLLPACVGYPEPVSTGVTKGYEWCVSKRIRGVNLSEAWPQMSWPERATAVRQLWDIMQAVHAVNDGAALALAAKRPWYGALDADEAFPRLRRFVETGALTGDQCAALTGILTEFFDRLPESATVLNHGDITMDNLLWHEGKIVSLMDFEHAVIAPEAVDLNSFVSLALFHGEALDGNGEGPDTDVFRQYKAGSAALIRSALAKPGSVGMLVGFSVLFRMRHLELWLDEPEGDINEFPPYAEILSFTKDRHGFLSEVLG